MQGYTEEMVSKQVLEVQVSLGNVEKELQTESIAKVLKMGA